jgi:hypothetical protein
MLTTHAAAGRAAGVLTGSAASRLAAAIDTLIIGGAANSGVGGWRKIGLTRDGGGHVNGFDGEAGCMAATARRGFRTPSPSRAWQQRRRDAGTVSPPIANKLAQTRPGTDTPVKVSDLNALGVASSVGAVFFVPPGFPGAGSMKVASYDASRWYSVEFEEDGAGAYDLTSATQNLQFTGGPEGITYVPQGSDSFPRDSILIALYGRGAGLTAPRDANRNTRLAESQGVLTGVRAPREPSSIRIRAISCSPLSAAEIRSCG